MEADMTVDLSTGIELQGKRVGRIHVDEARNEGAGR